MPPLAIGFGAPRGLGDPRQFPQPDHRMMLRYCQRADALGFDSVWIPDHFFFERPPGVLTPYPEAWTLMTAVAATTERVRVGSMVLAAGFRHPAMLAKMAGALQELSDGRLILGVGAGNQPAEHAAFGIEFERRVGRFDEYLRILSALLNNESLTLDGRHYQVAEATLRMTSPPVPIWVAASGDRMLRLTARYAKGWNGGGASQADGEPWRTKLAQLRDACRAQGRDASDLEISYSATVMVLPDAAGVKRAVDALVEIPPGCPPEEVHNRFVVGTPDQVAAKLRQAIDWGANHLICGLGAQPFTLWSDDMLELFAAEVLPRVRGGQ